MNFYALLLLSFTIPRAMETGSFDLSPGANGLLRILLTVLPWALTLTALLAIVIIPRVLTFSRLPQWRVIWWPTLFLAILIFNVALVRGLKSVASLNLGG
ncbi:hypothetical protein [Deinococcus multiflagellatus]|uniref:Uncharacterized protein n=1 Tax=Deinococcus multiflagellatus TaxID=1656887 RepID=A0ABW1ZUY6_9DEIO